MTARVESPPIRFGTSGWRGVIGDEFTLPRALAVARALACWVHESGHPPRVLVAHDARLGGERLAREAAAVLASEGLQVGRAVGVTPTPVLARAVARRHCGAGLVFTASHNPPAHHGLKVVGPSGGALEPGATRRLERLAVRSFGTGGPGPGRGGLVRKVDLVPEYLEALGRRVRAQAFASGRVRVFYDAMHGAGAGVLDRWLCEAGARVLGQRLAPDPLFGGGSPDPVPARLASLASAVGRGRGLRLGLANDGDADRYAAVDASGRVLSATQTLALLVDHLAREGRIRRGVAISVATGSLVERVARGHGLAVRRYPVGFKWLTAALLRGDADCAGEESGGFVWQAHGHDKDGILAAALLAEIVASTRAPLEERLAGLERRHGARPCGRTQVADGLDRRQRLARLRRKPPARVDGARVTAVDVRDGLRLELPDGFLMLRASGTEALIRIYGEAPSAPGLRARLALGAGWLAPRSSGNVAI